jgi:CRP-like cAMP-binding protein
MTLVKQDILTLKPGEILTKEGQPCSALYIVQEGQLKVYKTKGDKEIPVGLISSKEYIGEMAILLGRNYTTSVMALTEVKVICLEKSAIEKQLAQAPAWLVALTRGLVSRLDSANEILKRNGIEDEKMTQTIQAIESKFAHEEPE